MRTQGMNARFDVGGSEIGNLSQMDKSCRRERFYIQPVGTVNVTYDYMSISGGSSQADAEGGRVRHNRSFDRYDDAVTKPLNNVAKTFARLCVE